MNNGRIKQTEAALISISQTNEPSLHICRRARAMWVKTLAFDSYVITPRETGKTKRLVQFDISEQGVVKIECVAVGTGEVCPANSYSHHCSHVEAAIRRLERNIAKEHARQQEAGTELKRSRKLSKGVKKHPKQQGDLL